MDIELAIDPNSSTPEGFAAINIVERGSERLCALDLQYSKLAPLQSVNPLAFDFLLLGAAVYVIDKLVHRTTAADHWTRQLSLSLPVSNARLWQAVRRDLASCISFLTGDEWSLSFTNRQSELIRPRVRKKKARRTRLTINRPTGKAVSLFSGGLDSLVGVIDWMEQNPASGLVLVGHYDAQMGGPHSDQKSLLGPLRTAYPNRLSPVLVRVGHSNETVDQIEITLRARSLLFVSLGVFAASSLGPSVPLIIPENGAIALNVPLTPSRRGSCSTRTAHPFFLQSLASVLSRVGLANTLLTPLETKTKGETVTECLNPALLAATARASVSCAKRGHKKHFTRRTAKSCGRCMPCIYRRAGLHLAGWDDEVYGDDICIGEVDIAADGEKPNDLRACFSFLRRNATVDQISSLLLANGSLNVSRVPDYAAIVQRSMDEIRRLLRDKATRDVQRLAGL